MQKSQAQSLTARVPPGADDSLNVDLLSLVPAAPHAKPDRREDKLSRQDISRCINIWATMYLGRDEKTNAGELCLPSRPWLGRNPSSLKRFD